MSKAKPFLAGKGELVWVTITGEGKKDLNGNFKYVASLRFKNDDPVLAGIKKEINDYWNENKPKGKKMKSNGIREEWDKEKDAASGYSLVNFWTGTSFQDGKSKTVDVYDSKGRKVNMGDRLIGNSSIGWISGAMAVYTRPESAGITLYLNAIQLSKFVEYKGNVVLAEDEEDGFDGFGDELPLAGADDDDDGVDHITL